MIHPDHDKGGSPETEPPSKTRRKVAMHALQDLGEALVAVAPERLAELDLPERLVDAIAAARRITAHEGRRRQMQFVGRLMRDVDPEPIRTKLDAWAQGPRQATALLHRLEAWRERLLKEPEALAELAAAQARLDRDHLRRIIRLAREERAQGQPPKFYRQIFQELKNVFENEDPS